MAGEDKKILIIVYYWPPSGGSGVQRWVKLAKYLVRQGIKVFVITVDENKASYLQIDNSLESEVDKDIQVFKTNSFEIINLFAKIFGKKKVPTAGFYNLDKKSLVHKLSLIIRSNLFIPDPRRGWNRFAYKKAKEIIRKEGISKVITSTPPHSSQLIGLKLKKRMGITWIADLRDPWTDIFYYKLLKHSVFSHNINKKYELEVLLKADHILTVSRKLKEIFLSKSKRINAEKIHIIPNGYDPDDFVTQTTYNAKGVFTIGYTGTMSEQYAPWGFLKAFREFIKISGESVKLEITGTVAPVINDFIKELGIERSVQIKEAVPHNEIPGILASYSTLLLVIPQVENAGLILTGKLFEYLASGKPIILIGPKNGNAEEIIHDCNAGSSFEWDDEESISAYLTLLIDRYKSGNLLTGTNENIKRYSRDNQALALSKILFS